MHKNISIVAKNIKKHTKEKGLSQDKLAKLADIAHVPIIKIESGGIQKPTMDTIQKIAKPLCISLDNLIK